MKAGSPPGRPGMTNRRHFLLALGTTALDGCGSPFTVLRTSATQSPAKLPGFTVLPFAYERFVMKGKPLADWLASRTQSQAESFAADQRKMESTFFAELRRRAARFQFERSEGAEARPDYGVLACDCLREQQGIFRFQTASGVLIDEVEVRYYTGAGDITSHMHMFGGLAAEHLADHLETRS